MAITQPKVQYARSKDIHIAYQVMGKGAIDLVLMPGFISHLDLHWEEPALAGFLNDLSSSFRLIMFDKRGTGLSDRTGQPPTFEERMEDIDAVMQAAGSKRAVIMGVSEGGPMAILMAATYPEKVSHLILLGTFARGAYTDDYPWVMKKEQLMKWAATFSYDWGNPDSLQVWAPDHCHDQFLIDWWGKLLRSGASPGSALQYIHMQAEIDVRSVLPSVYIPALVMHRKNDQLVRVGNGRYLAEQIPNATYVELEGSSHLWWLDDTQSIMTAINNFINGTDVNVAPTKRVLSTVLFSDIVSSTDLAVQKGDTEWRKILERHDSLMVRAVQRHRGTWIKSTGDGCLATFDSPSRAMRCAVEMTEHARTLGIEIRVGLHTGECEIMGEDIGGIAVHIAARVQGKAEASEIVCSETVKSLVIGSGFSFKDKGRYPLKGVEGEWLLYSYVPEEHER